MAARSAVVCGIKRPASGSAVVDSAFKVTGRRHQANPSRAIERVEADAREHYTDLQRLQHNASVISDVIGRQVEPLDGDAALST